MTMTSCYWLFDEDQDKMEEKVMLQIEELN